MTVIEPRKKGLGDARANGGPGARKGAGPPARQSGPYARVLRMGRLGLRVPIYCGSLLSSAAFRALPRLPDSRGLGARRTKPARSP